MSTIGQSERATQNRVIALFCDELGYRYLGDWSHRLVSEALGGYTSTGDPVLDLAVTLDATVKRARPEGWRGVTAREEAIKEALYNVLRDFDEVDRLFVIIEKQSEY